MARARARSSPTSCGVTPACAAAVEKAKTTPDAYPMSLNALVTGCNQKSNREPLMQLNDIEKRVSTAESGDV